LTKVLHTRITQFIQYPSLIPQHQNGFRQHHSTTLQLKIVSKYVVLGFERKKYTAAAFLDVSAAFDSVWHDGLLYKLKLSGIPHYLYHTVKSFLQERTFQVRMGSTLSDKKKISAGVPQGAILSPTLYNIYCFDLPSPTYAYLSTYSDDTMFATQHSDLDTAITHLQACINELTNWYSKWKLAVNARKTEAEIFTLCRLH
jgi:hypothetical protein